MISPCKLRSANIKVALDEWQADHPGCLLQPSTLDFSDQIESRCGGNAGITGLCLNALTEEAAEKTMTG